jgi:putative nucleotidyltransferase with HDIG domain
MKVESNILRSRIARRIFGAFIVCSLIPVILLALVSLYQVNQQLEAQGRERLRRAARNYGMSVMEHLLFCEDELKHLNAQDSTVDERQVQKFSATGKWLPDGTYRYILGEKIPRVHLTDAQKKHLASGGTLLTVWGKPANITLVRYLDSQSETSGRLMGTVRGDYLWGLTHGNNLPPLAEFAAFTHTGLPLTHSLTGTTLPDTVAERFRDTQGRLRLRDAEWFMAGTPLFLQAQFGANLWHLVVMQPVSHVLAPIARFKLIFILVVVLALLLVVAMSRLSLRRSLEPIDALKTGARRIARNDFAYRVKVNSRDEFEELAQHFNDMSSQLGRQFDLLSAQEQINHATLTGSDFERIAGLAISRIMTAFAVRLVAIGRINIDDPMQMPLYLSHGNRSGVPGYRTVQIESTHLSGLHPNLPWLTITENDLLRSYLPEEILPEISRLTLFPVFVKDRLYALLYVADIPDSAAAKVDLGHIRQIADHLAVAWSNVNLIHDLKRLTLGSMQALARAVDAKSPWTAGHSARVMRIALSVARGMGFDNARIDRLQQAALLHDIGKIGVPARILDKPGKLTDDEFATIRRHPTIGETILSPIEAFSEILPMVRQHHERWDGKGYPDGLAGEKIVLEARILAVADTYDAMASDRPYRQGMPLPRIFEIIQAESGCQFDPSVVTVFLELMAERKVLAA